MKSTHTDFYALEKVIFSLKKIEIRMRVKNTKKFQ